MFQNPAELFAVDSYYRPNARTSVDNIIDNISMNTSEGLMREPVYFALETSLNSFRQQRVIEQCDC